MAIRAVALTLLLALGACTVASSPPPAPSAAQTCAVPANLTAAPAYAPPADEVVDDVETAYHLLAVSWSPQACRSGKDYPDAEHQCRDNRFGLTLHGLWPNGPEGRHPRYCAAAPAMRVETVRRHFCMTPSPVLQQHEWAAHGTCGWSTPEAYFDQAAALWNDLERPNLEAIPAADLTAGAIRRAFAGADPDIPESAVTVVLAEGGWLREVRLCYSRAFQPMACPRGVGPADDTLVKLAARGATGR
jgi:ribonuclease T2